MIPESYRHSGQAPAVGLFLSMIATIVCSLILGVVYAFAVSWIPVVQLSVAATAGFGAAIGAVAGQSARVGKIRNGAVIPFFSLMGAAAGLWMAWVFDAKARFGMEAAPLLLNPLLLLSYMQGFYQEGFWSMGKNGPPVSGLFLGFIWVVETLVILGLSFFVARQIVGALPFCEACDGWTGKTEGFCRFVLPDDEVSVLQTLKDGELSTLSSLPVCVGDQDATLKVDLCKCPSCDDSTYVTIHRVKVSVNKKGEASVGLVPVVSHGKLSPEEMSWLQAKRENFA